MVGRKRKRICQGREAPLCTQFVKANLYCANPVWLNHVSPGKPPMSSIPAKAAGSHGKDLTTGSIAKNLIFFALPMLLGSLVHVTYSLINMMWVGNWLGATAMAALTVGFPVFFVLNAFGQGLSLASNVLVSQSYGAKDWPRLRMVVQNSMVLTVITGLLCFVLGELATEGLLRLMNTPAEVLPVAVSYLHVFLWTTPLMFGMFYLASVMRGAGDSKTPLYFQAGSLVVTAVLDPLLMFGWLGFPRMGLNGTAVATIISQAGALVALAWHMRRVRHIASPSWRRLGLNREVSLLTLRIGLPSMMQQALVSLGILVIVALVNRFGEHCAAAYGAAMRIDLLAFMPAMSIGMAASTLSGQNIGAHKFDRVKQTFRWGLVISLALTLPATLVSVGVPGLFMRLFAHDADVVATGAHYLRIVGVGYLMWAVMFLSNGIINGSGRTVATTVFTLVGFWVVRIPLALFLSRQMNSVEGIWYGVLISSFVGAGISVTYYLTGRWKTPVVARTVPITAPEAEPIPEMQDGL